MAGVPRRRRRAVRPLRARLAERRPQLAAPPPRRRPRDYRDPGAPGPHHGVPVAATGACWVHPPPRAAPVARGAGPRAPRPAVGARGGGPADGGEHPPPHPPPPRPPFGDDRRAPLPRPVLPRPPLFSPPPPRAPPPTPPRRRGRLLARR